MAARPSWYASSHEAIAGSGADANVADATGDGFLSKDKERKDK